MGRWAIVNTALGIIVLLLGLQIFFTWRRALPGVEVTSASTDAGGAVEGKSEGKAGGGRRAGKRAGAAADKAEQPTVLVNTIINKDLFDPSRQRPTEEAKAPPPPKEIGPPPNLTLVGVRMIGRDREAFVADVAQGNQQRRLRVGDEIGGYTLKTIHPSRVTLASAAGESLSLSLTIEKGGGGAPRPPGAPGTPGVPPRPGQPGVPPPGGMASPAAGVQPSPAAGVQPAGQPGQAPGVQPRLPRAATQPVRPGSPAAGMQQAPGAAPAAAVPSPQPAVAGVAPTGPQTIPPPNPNLPAAVREKLEQLRSN